MTGFEIYPFVLSLYSVNHLNSLLWNLSEVLTEFESVLGQSLPLIEGKFDQVFPVSVFSETSSVIVVCKFAGTKVPKNIVTIVVTIHFVLLAML